MKVVAVVPMKLNNRRLPQKNTKLFSDGRPLCHLILSTLEQVELIDEVYVFCSSEEIRKFIPSGVKYLKRSEKLDQDTTTMNEVLLSFQQIVPADIYVLAHATAPFVSKQSIITGLKAVAENNYDSAFAVKRLQDFFWKNNKPLNYSLDSIPRTQDLEPYFVETCGLYIFKSNVIRDFSRRIGNNPFLIETGEIESIDIDEKEDFEIADAVYMHKFSKS